MYVLQWIITHCPGTLPSPHNEVKNTHGTTSVVLPTDIRPEVSKINKHDVVGDERNLKRRHQISVYIFGRKEDK